MALVLVATPGASNANTYVTLADAETIALEHLNMDSWNAATTATKNAALANATRDIDTLSLLGTPYGQRWDDDASDYQPLHFPTTMDFDSDGDGYIPDDVKRATVLQADYLIRSGAARQAADDIIATGVTSQSVGHLSQTYARSGVSAVCPMARRYLKRWLEAGRKLEFA